MRKIVMFGVAGVLAATASGCGVLGGSSDEPSSPTPSEAATTSASAPASATTSASAPASATTPPTSGTPSATGSPSAGASSSTAPTPADPGQGAGADELGTPVATRTSAIGGKRVVLNLYPVLRDGTTSHVNFTLAGVTAGERVQVTSSLGDGNYKAIDFSGDTADGLQLVDGKNSKLYLVASDGAGQCLCSRELSGVFLEPGNRVIFSATFAAPPADVTAVDVRLPTFGTVKSVPVS